jgi:hypothetical protein
MASFSLPSHLPSVSVPPRRTLSTIPTPLHTVHVVYPLPMHRKHFPPPNAISLLRTGKTCQWHRCEGKQGLQTVSEWAGPRLIPTPTPTAVHGRG